MMLQASCEGQTEKQNGDKMRTAKHVWPLDGFGKTFG